MVASLGLFLTYSVGIVTPNIVFVGSVAPSSYIEKKVMDADASKLKTFMPDRISYAEVGDSMVLWDKADPLLSALREATNAYKEFASSLKAGSTSDVAFETLGDATKRTFLNSLPWPLDSRPESSVTVTPCLYLSGKSGKTTASASYEPAAADPLGSFRASDQPKEQSPAQLRAVNDPRYDRVVRLLKGDKSVARAVSAKALDRFDKEVAAMQIEADRAFKSVFDALTERPEFKSVSDALRTGKKFDEMPEELQEGMLAQLRTRWKSQGFKSFEEAKDALASSDVSMMFGLKFRIRIEREGRMDFGEYLVIRRSPQAPPP